MGKALSIIGGILTLVATFVLNWFTINGGSYAYGIGGIINLPGMFTNAQQYEKSLGMPFWLVYVIAIVVILALAAGVLQILGTKSLAAAIIGSILPLVIAIIILLSSFGIIGSNLVKFLDVFKGGALIEGLIPFNIIIIGNSSIGTYVLLVGGILGFIGGFKSRKEI